MHEQARSRRNTQMHTLAALDYDASGASAEFEPGPECVECGSGLDPDSARSGRAPLELARCAGCVSAAELGIGLSTRNGLPSDLPRTRRAAKDPFQQ